MGLHFEEVKAGGGWNPEQDGSALIIAYVFEFMAGGDCAVYRFGISEDDGRVKDPVRAPAGPNRPVPDEWLEGWTGTGLYLLQSRRSYEVSPLREAEGGETSEGTGKVRADRTQEARPGKTWPDLREELREDEGYRGGSIRKVIHKSVDNDRNDSSRNVKITIQKVW